MVVEVDGADHGERVDEDEERTLWLSRNGVRVLRFNTAEVLGQTAWVLEAIQDACVVPA